MSVLRKQRPRHLGSVQKDRYCPLRQVRRQNGSVPIWKAQRHTHVRKMQDGWRSKKELNRTLEQAGGGGMTPPRVSSIARSERYLFIEGQNEIRYLHMEKKKKQQNGKLLFHINRNVSERPIFMIQEGGF